LTRTASASMISVQIHCTARNLILLASEGKSKLKTVISFANVSNMPSKNHMSVTYR
jgi:hypothetical protein